MLSSPFQRLLIALTVLAAIIACTVILACGPTVTQRYQQELKDTGPPAIHAVHSERLRQIMDELSELALERLPQEMDASVARDRRVREVTVIASKLAEDAGLLTSMLSRAELMDRDRDAFNKYADKLKREAYALKAAGEANDTQAMSDLLEEMITTCNGCHGAFRDLPPVPERG